MQYLHVSFARPEENLACDEALLELCERDGGDELLRFWEAPAPFVVIGSASRVLVEVNADWCRKNGVPILRRTSGGCAVLQGAGCLNFSLILKIPEAGPLASISGTNALITRRHEQVLKPVIGQDVRAEGLTDLALGALKFSGNAQRRKRRFVLFHGTFLLDFEIPLVTRTLAIPPRQPSYRQNRPHEEFLANVRVPSAAIKRALLSAWHADEEFTDLPAAATDHLARSRFGSDDWNFRF